MSSSIDDRRPSQALRGTVADRIRASDSRRIPVTREEVAAARLQVSIDKRLGRTTPDWIVRLAEAATRF